MNGIEAGSLTIMYAGQGLLVKKRKAICSKLQMRMKKQAQLGSLAGRNKMATILKILSNVCESLDSDFESMWIS